MTSVRPGIPDDLWAITTYYNFSGFRRRLANYRTFRRHLQAPLATVELSLGDSFELTEGDADILIQVGGGDAMWQKERLLNVALSALPPGCRKVAWLDCDLVFDSPDWAARTSALLDSVPLLQPFAHAYRTPKDWQPSGPIAAGDDVIHSAGWLIENGMPVDEALRGIGEEIRCAHGWAWAARRSTLEAHGLYDANVVGGGDTSVFRGAFGYFDLVVERFRLNPRRAQHYLDWAGPFFADIRGDVGYVPGNIFHLWHGSLDRRRYTPRHEEFSAFRFNPYEDIALSDAQAWRWNSDKPEMHAYLRRYFDSRREDG